MISLLRKGERELLSQRRFLDLADGRARNLVHELEPIGEPPPRDVGPQVVEQLRKLESAGVSRVLCQHMPQDDLEFVEILGRELAALVA